jgi:4-amino-4-deoxychorismate lyase
VSDQDTGAPRLIVDGVPSETIDVRDRGFALGDGVFETFRVRAGEPLAWAYHWQRLAEGAAVLGFAPPPEHTLLADCVAATGGTGEGTLRLTVTRGQGPRGYAPPTAPRPTRVAAFHPGELAAPRHGLRLRWCVTRLASQPRLAGIKHLNRLEQVLARSEWTEPAIDEGVVRSQDGRVIECTASNLFWVADGRLVTPALDDCGVAGVVRRIVIERARAAGWAVEVRAAEVDELASAEEVLVTNSVKRVAGVRVLGDRQYPAPGPVTEWLARAVEEVA